jgi:hypothetical protein
VLDLEKRPSSCAKLAGPAERGSGFPLGGVFPGIPGGNSEATQESSALAEGPQTRVVRQEQGDNILQNMRARNGRAKFLQKSLQVLFGALLRVERDFIMMRLLAAGDFLGHGVVGLGLSHPLGRQLFHRALCPSS